jgi:hypothetical protein
LIDHYVQQMKAEQAAREEERKRQEEARKSAEVRRLEEERRIREVSLAEELRRAEEAKNSREAKRVADQERTELLARTEELRKALEEVRLAREAAEAAEQQRLAATKAADDATNTAEQAIAAKRDAASVSGDPSKVAALPKLDKPLVSSGSFDGDWNVTISCNATSTAQAWSNQFSGKIRSGAFFGQRGVKGTPASFTLSGRISTGGSATLTVAGLTGPSQFTVGNSPPGTPYSWSATARFENTRGRGRRTDGRRECSLVFSKN